jgi:4-carboxymuconolactone decarboxylase
MDPEDRYRKGLNILMGMSGAKLEMVTSKLAEVAPDFARMTVEFPFGDLFSRDGIDMRAREIAAIASIAALGNAMPQLRAHVATARKIGMSRGEIVEVLMQTSVYAGFPAAINALTACHDLLVAPSTVEPLPPAVQE